MTSLIIDWLFYWGYYAWRTPLWLRWLRICLQWRRPGFDPWIRKIPRRREWLPTPVFLTGISHGQRSLVGYSPWGRKESDTTEQLTHTHTHTHTRYMARLVHREYKDEEGGIPTFNITISTPLHRPIFIPWRVSISVFSHRCYRE